MENFPDNPIIRNCERTGYPDGEEPKILKCPVCGEKTNWFYRNNFDYEIVGCEYCIRLIEAYEEEN